MLYRTTMDPPHGYGLPTGLQTRRSLAYADNLAEP